MMIDRIGKELEMSQKEIKLFRQILALINDKENGMYESVQKELDRLISEVVLNDSE